eukprot:NODE_35_length_36362_cov_0.944434.p12 type:complete len:329 gc:universal NODE_35_length_36362_cov_0.944434:2594-3580(+)
MIFCTSVSGMVGQFQQHYLTRSLFREERMQGNLGGQNKSVRSEYKQHLLSLKFKDKSLEKKYLATRWRETILTNRRYSAFLVLNAAISIIYEHFWKFNDTTVLMYRCLFHGLPLIVLMAAIYFINHTKEQELSKKSIRVAWLYSAVREKVVNYYRITQVGLLLVFLSILSVYIHLTTSQKDAPFESVLMLVYLQFCVSTRFGTSYFLFGTAVLLIQSVAVSFFRPDVSNYVVGILFSAVNAMIFIRLTALKRRKLFMFESSEQHGLFTQLDTQVKSIETLSTEYRQSYASSNLSKGNLKTSSNTNSTLSSSSGTSYKFMENVLSLYSE